MVALARSILNEHNSSMGFDEPTPSSVKLAAEIILQNDTVTNDTVLLPILPCLDFVDIEDPIALWGVAVFWICFTIVTVITLMMVGIRLRRRQLSSPYLMYSLHHAESPTRRRSERRRPNDLA